MPRDYELGVIIDPEVGDERARALVERVTQTIANNQGQVVRVNAWGRRRLAYPIDHHRDGLYFFFDTTMEPSTVAEVERTLRVNEDILRHLMKARDPKVVAQQRQRDAEAEAQAEFEAAQAEAARQAEAERAANAPAAEEAPAAAEEAPAAAEEAPAAAEEAPAAAEAEAPAAPVDEAAAAPEAAQPDEADATTATIPSEAEADA